METIASLQRQYDEALPHADPRTKNWFLLVNSPFPVWILTASYILFVFIGPRVMKNREPLALNKFMVVYNLTMVAWSLYMFIELLSEVIKSPNYGYICSNYSSKSWTDPHEKRIANVLWWYFFSKAVELIDTVLMILRKKTRQVSFLHVFHHATMLNIWWWVMMFIPGGISWFGSCLNCFVHVVMYLYYGLSAIPSLREMLWWKKYITRLQLIQFFMSFTHTVISLNSGCDFPSWGLYLLSSYMVIMIILFSNFYIRTYFSRKSVADKQKHSNGNDPLAATNGFGDYAANGSVKRKKMKYIE